MPPIIRCLFLSFSIVLLSQTANAQFRVKVRFEEIANLTYQLDCVGNLPINCGVGNLGELWNSEFLKTGEDRLMLKEWERLRDLYSQNVQLGKASSSLSQFDKFRIAGFQATGAEDYAARLDLLTNPADRRLFERVIRHFQPAFKRWWQREAVKSGDSFAKQTDALLRSPKIFGRIKQFYDFYASVLPADYEISFNLLYIPGAVKEPSSGQQLQNYSLVEFKAKERPAQRIDIAVHELTHFFYDNLPPESYDKLRAAFYAENRASAIPAFNLLNETLATAFGNGMIARAVTPPAEFEKYLATKKSFYNNEVIDRAAKAVLPWLDEWLKNKRTINDAEFVNQYIAILERAFGEELLRPRLYLSEMFLFVDKKYGVSMRRNVRRTLETASLYASEGSLADENILDSFKSQPRLNSVFIVHPDNVEELLKNKIISEAQVKQIRNEYDAKQAVLFGAERAPLTYIYIVVAKDAAGANKLVEQLAAAQQFRGVYKDQ